LKNSKTLPQVVSKGKSMLPKSMKQSIKRKRTSPEKELDELLTTNDKEHPKVHIKDAYIDISQYTKNY
jgi:hypothetical protein